MDNDQPVFIIVDDEPDMCWALENILKKRGWSSEHAFSAHDAMRLVESRRFDLAFVDAKLPDTDGIELARHIKMLDPAIRIVIISGFYYTDDPKVQKALEEGLICAFVAKPFFHDDILNAIKAAWRRNGDPHSGRNPVPEHLETLP
jgi:DNA-binding NtrC family response regulator